MPKSIYPSVDEMTNLKTRDRKRKSKTLKSDKEKLEAIKEIIWAYDISGEIHNGRIINILGEDYKKIKAILED